MISDMEDMEGGELEIIKKDKYAGWILNVRFQILNVECLILNVKYQMLNMIICLAGMTALCDGTLKPQVIVSLRIS